MRPGQSYIKMYFRDINITSDISPLILHHHHSFLSASVLIKKNSFFGDQHVLFDVFKDGWPFLAMMTLAAAYGAIGIWLLVGNKNTNTISPAHLSN